MWRLPSQMWNNLNYHKFYNSHPPKRGIFNFFIINVIIQCEDYPPKRGRGQHHQRCRAPWISGWPDDYHHHHHHHHHYHIFYHHHHHHHHCHHQHHHCYCHIVIAKTYFPDLSASFVKSAAWSSGLPEHKPREIGDQVIRPVPTWKVKVIVKLKEEKWKWFSILDQAHANLECESDYQI